MSIRQALSEFHDLHYYVRLLGRVVDQHEMGDLDNITGTGRLLEDIGGRLWTVAEILDDHDLSRFQDEIAKLQEDHLEKAHKKCSRSLQRNEIRKKHDAEAEQEIKDKGLDIEDDPED
jgi:hypothetical protein